MSDIETLKNPDGSYELIERVLAAGDLSELSAEERTQYLLNLCKSLGLNPLTRPFEFIPMYDKKTGKNKLTPYARKDCTEQLRKIKEVTVTKIETKIEQNAIYIVTVYVKLPSGREDVSTGAVNIKGLSGDDLANAFMKAETKAKRRATLSICGLGFLDESELETIKDITPKNHQVTKKSTPAAKTIENKSSTQPKDFNYYLALIRTSPNEEKLKESFGNFLKDRPKLSKEKIAEIIEAKDIRKDYFLSIKKEKEAETVAISTNSSEQTLALQMAEHDASADEWTKSYDQATGEIYATTN